MSGFIMIIIRNIIVALSMYSRIPMPVFEWKEDDMKYSISFIGVVGMIIGVIQYSLCAVGNHYAIPVIAIAFLFAAVPLVLTGGFHVDGFMDVQDAFNSYKSKEEKLKILKDPHIGAFAVISFAIYGLLFLAATYILIDSNNMNYIAVACIGFVLLRSLGGYLSVNLTLARQEGMLHEETKKTNAVSKIILLVSIIICLAAIGCMSLVSFFAIVVSLIIFILWFKKKCYMEFGGINGDTIGYFITVGELIVIIITAILTFANM